MPKKQKITQAEEKVLRDKAKSVSIEEISSAKTIKVINDLKSALEQESDGVAIAAPQIGVSLKIFVVSKRAFELVNIDEDKKFQDQVFINPVIKKLSKDKKEMEEGCLSVRWKYGNVLRSNKATIEAYDEFGKKFSRGGVGLIAQIFQHETDHLNGILFIDKAKDIVDLPPRKTPRNIPK